MPRRPDTPPFEEMGLRELAAWFRAEAELADRGERPSDALVALAARSDARRRRFESWLDVPLRRLERDLGHHRRSGLRERVERALAKTPDAVPGSSR